jgi:tRNA(Ile)-lysidine synthase
MSLPESFQHFINKQNLFQPQQRLLLAVSGGLDSVVLTHLCFEAGFSFAIAHCNFGLRGEESNRDEHFVRQLGNQYGVPVFVQQFDTANIAATTRLSIQETARKLRYDWFDTLMNITEEQPFERLLTAHHANDNVETLLMHLFKGTGIDGLKGIPQKNGYIVRPLLFAKHSDVAAYATEKKLQYVEDSSNLSEKYDRNFIRHSVLPLVREKYPQVEDNINASITRFKEAAFIYREAIEQKKKKLMEQRGTEWHIPVRKLKKQVPLHTIVFELMRPFGFSAAQTGDLVRLLDAGTGKQIASTTHRVVKNRDWFIISPVDNTVASVYVIDEANSATETETGTLVLKEIKIEAGTILPADPFTALLDLDKINFPLILRKWKPGDYFYPLGMKKKKKLARFFIDRKLGKPEKEKIWVLESGKKIIWVAGHQIDERVKIIGTTTKGLKCLLKPTTT